MMSGFRFYYCLLPFVVAMGAQPARGAVLAHPADATAARADWSGQAVACCDPQPEAYGAGDKIIVAQIFDIVTGAAKLLYNATDNTKEQEAATRAAELQKQQEERAQAEARQNAQRAMDADEQRRARLSDPFAASGDPFATAPPKGQLNGAGAGGSMLNPNQVNVSAMPPNSAMPPVLPGAVMDLPGQVSVPANQAAAPVGTIVISMDQEAPAANAAGGQETPASMQPPAPLAATNNSGGDKDTALAHPAPAEKPPAPPAKKSDNPFDN
jgi:hypothetical protein